MKKILILIILIITITSCKKENTEKINISISSPKNHKFPYNLTGIWKSDIQLYTFTNTNLNVITFDSLIEYFTYNVDTNNILSLYRYKYNLENKDSFVSDTFIYFVLIENDSMFFKQSIPDSYLFKGKKQ